MKNTIDYVQAIYALIGEAWPGVPEWDKDYYTIKDTDRPCYIVEIGKQNEGYLTSGYMEQAVDVTIYYFAAKRYIGYADLLTRKAEIAQRLVGALEIEGKFICHIDEVEFDIDRDDMTLAAMFELYAVQPIPEGEGEYMEELDYNDTEYEE